MNDERKNGRKAISKKRKELIREVDNIVEKYASEIMLLAEGESFQELLESMIPFAGYELGSCVDKRVRELIRYKALERRL